MIRVLIADDDTELGQLLVEYLGSQGLSARSCPTAEAAMELLDAQSSQVDVLVLDVMLPGIDGLTALRRIRRSHSLPVLMLSGRGEPVDRVVGLELGADDYLSKPCLPRELLARIQALVRRSQVAVASAQGALQVGALRMTPAERKVQLSGKALDVTGAEFDVLRVLMRCAGTVVSREQLTREGLHRELEREDRAIDVHISRLRKKFARGDNAPAIDAVRGAGYILAVGESQSQ